MGGYDGDDVIYGGPGDDTELDVASADEFVGNDGQRDKLHCGDGRDTYYAEKIDYVDSRCEVKLGNSVPSGSPGPPLVAGGGPAILLPAAALLLLGSGILTYAILRRR